MLTKESHRRPSALLVSDESLPTLLQSGAFRCVRIRLGEDAHSSETGAVWATVHLSELHEPAENVLLEQGEIGGGGGEH